MLFITKLRKEVAFSSVTIRTGFAIPGGLRKSPKAEYAGAGINKNVENDKKCNRKCNGFLSHLL